MPFSDTRIIALESEHTQDHTYVAKIHLPSIVNSQKLVYTFLITKKYEKIEEAVTEPLDAGDRTSPHKVQ